MKPIVFKHSGVWWTLYRDKTGKRKICTSTAWGLAVIEALIAVHVCPKLTWKDCE